MNELNTMPSIPAGYRRNAQGHLVPTDTIKPVDDMRDELVNALFDEALQLRCQMAAFKQRAMQQISDFIDLSAAEYGVNYGATKGNVTLTSFDGERRVRRAVDEHRIFDERIQVAKEKIEACITKWSGGADAKLMALVNRAFNVNKQGYIDINSVLSLRDLDIDDEDWQEAMRAVTDSIKVSGSTRYIRFYQREGNKEYTQLLLDISRL
ncbi:sulfate transporter [Sodalis-like symbiont of Philaenus spumarius]|uniref:DUF3164 family protein n=1 Tax=Arsenophonus sp. PmNCSU2021_1 TaxID=3118989 RepID=UPI00020DAEC5|nr:sulfate transporter [Sodalis-like symbiont of Philaenus spumarius]BAN97856.1 hypothetical protein E05_30900 [Plautia stali symbiont]